MTQGQGAVRGESATKTVKDRSPQNAENAESEYLLTNLYLGVLCVSAVDSAFLVCLSPSLFVFSSS
jgi:hypothetical protein